MRLDTRIITDQEEFRRMKGEWNELLQRSYTNTIFLTWEWIYTWWEVFGKGADIFLIIVRNEKGELVGIAPLHIRRSLYYKFPVKEMAFIGMGLSDRQDFIISGKDTRIIDEIISKIYENKGKWDIVHLEQIPDDSLLAEKEFIQYYRPEIELSSICPYLKIEGDWEAYFKSIKRDFRAEIRNKTKRLNELGHWEFRVDRKISNVEGLINCMENVEIKSRKIETNKDLFSSRKNRDFLNKVCDFCVENKWIDFSSLRIGDKFIAYALGFIYNDIYYGYSTAYDKEFFKLSPGKITINEKIKWFFENKNIIKIFDFSRGNSKVKTEWTSTKRQHIRMVFFNRSLYSKITRFAVFYIRPTIKKFLRKKHV